MFQISSVGERYTEDLLDEEIEEGPLDESSTNTTYLADEALSEEGLNVPLVHDNPGSLVDTTQDESSLISPEITDPTLIAKTRDKTLNYLVETGDTISGIATKFNISVTTVLWENGLTAYSTIKPGQTLRILPVNGLSYSIKRGDNLQKIANTYQTDVSKIIEFNKLASANDIKEGQSLILPDAVRPSAVAARPASSQVARSSSIKDIFIPPAAPRSQAKYQWPTNSRRISQYFRWRHTGLDLPNKTGQPIYAAEAGKVETSGWNKGGYGYYIIINHGNGVKTLYAHSSKLLVKAGESVERGQVIALIGSTGRSTGPHLHFEVRINGGFKNPLDYVR